MNTKKVITFLACVLVPEAIGFASSLFAGDIAGKYEALTKAPLSPPGWIFGIVWAILYFLMGVSLYLIITSTDFGEVKTVAYILFGAQLVVNFIWSIIFFGMDNFWLSVAVILLLDALVIACIWYFWRISRGASLLLIPYTLWILFATYLTVAFAILN